MSEVSQEVLKQLYNASLQNMTNLGVPTIQISEEEAKELERRGYSVSRNGPWTVIKW